MVNSSHLTRSSAGSLSQGSQKGQAGLLLDRGLDGVHHLLHPLQVEPGRPGLGYVLLFQNVNLGVVSCKGHKLVLF